MGLKERREREKESLRQEILDAARELFVEEGYERVSMRKIAEKIEYSPTTIYLYFKDKSELLFELCEESFAKLAQTIEKISVKYDDPLVALREAGRAYVHFGLKHPNHYKLTFIQPLHEEISADRFPAEKTMGKKAFGYLRSGVAACVKHRKFREVDVEMTSQSLWAALHGVTSLLIAHHDFPWVAKDKLIDFVIDTMIAGLKP